MLKRIVLFAFVVFPVMTFAQEPQKTAYANLSEVVTLMPEYLQMMDSLKSQEDEFRAELQVLWDEYTKKMQDYVDQQETLNESIKLRRQQELQDIEQRSQNFQQYAQQKQQELEQTMFIPIQEKLQKAIDDVGRENNFLYIANAAVYHYVSPSATDATPLIKRKLGL